MIPPKGGGDLAFFLISDCQKTRPASDCYRIPHNLHNRFDRSLFCFDFATTFVIKSYIYEEVACATPRGQLRDERALEKDKRQWTLRPSEG